MRILSWNMNKRPAAWKHLVERSDEFDVALLQETRPPSEFVGDWATTTWRPMRGKAGSSRTRWGSAIASKRVALEPFQIPEAYPWLSELSGSVVIARSEQPPVWLASVHFRATKIPKEDLERLPWKHIPLCTPNGSVWETDVIPFELGRLFGTDSFLWGGDLNSAESMDDGGFLGGNRKLRSLWREAGFHDLRLRFHQEEQQTLFRHWQKPYQLDHVFADAETESRVSGWAVDETPAVSDPSFSDHAPVLVQIDEP